jgi:hypothetical protein
LNCNIGISSRREVVGRLCAIFSKVQTGLERNCHNESKYADPYQPMSLTELKVLVIRGIALELLVREAKCLICHVLLLQ